MPGICRLSDNDSGHPPCFPPRPNNKASVDTFVDNKGVHRLTDTWNVHCCKAGCHDAKTVSASNSVFVNNLGAARIGDSVSCGSTIVEGSTTVIIG